MKNFPAGTLSTFRQPREALNPSGFAIEAAEHWALERTAHISVEQVRLTSFWYIDYVRQQAPAERKTRYIMRLAQSHNYGAACGLSVPIPGSDFDLVGEDSREIIKTCRYRDDIDRAALVDLIIGHVSSAPGYEVTLSDPEQARELVERDAAARTNSPCTVRTGLVDGSALAPIVSAPIAIITCSARAMGFLRGLG